MDCYARHHRRWLHHAPEMRDFCYSESVSVTVGAVRLLTRTVMSASATESISGTLVRLMEEQVDILRRMDERQRAGDLSRQPMPEVPATSSSAWNALLKSALTETIQPKVERWRSGLDALLVFLGLFSAIVTSFFVESLDDLKQDQTVRMNELVANLTEIVIAISGVPPASLPIAKPAVFRPDSTDVRLNAYWSLSLILSLSIAALAVACRGYLNMVGYSHFTKAAEKLVDIRTRWLSSERFLGPTIELLPQMLVLPVILFIAGLLDTLFSSVLRLSPVPMPILFTSGLSLLFITAVALLLVYTLTQRSINPAGTGVFLEWIAALRTRFVALNHNLARHNTLRVPERKPSAAKTQPPLSSEAQFVYHDVVQSTHNDDTLNEASAALYSVIQTLAMWPRYAVSASQTSSGLLAQERATLLHLLSPEASLRSNRTAAQVILRIQETNRIRYSQTDMTILIPALLDAARLRIASAPFAIASDPELWNSPFLQAMAVVGNANAANYRDAPVIAFLASEYVSVEQLPSDSDPSEEHALRTRTVVDAVPEDTDTDARRLETLAAVLDPTTDGVIPASGSASRSNSSSSDSTLRTSLPRQPTSAASPLSIPTLLASFIYLPVLGPPGMRGAHTYAQTERTTVLELLLRWLMHIPGSSPCSDVWPTVLFFIVATLAKTLLDDKRELAASDSSSDGAQSSVTVQLRQKDSETHLLPLAHLCLCALAKIASLHQYAPQLPSLVSYASRALQRHWKFPRVPARDGDRDQKLFVMMRAHLALVHNFASDETWRWSAKQRGAVLRELEGLEAATVWPEDSETSLPDMGVS
ncbi:hypothetical protein MKEN_01308600 [Mycena kentingensis (nom. inval.)]|nr:hypothetical protein MKEN_01308600 [Mycena kentingensis (nom. inval.)]